MGFLGSSKKKSPDPFQAAVEQQRRRTPLPRLRDRQSETARQHNADHVRFGSSFRGHGNKGPSGYPYQQPSFGFYSGENLAAGRGRNREGWGRSISVDEGFKSVQNGHLPAPLERDPSLPQDGCSPGPTFWDGPGYGSDAAQNLHNSPFDDTVPMEAPFGGPLHQEPYPFSRGTSFNPTSRSIPENISQPLQGRRARYQLPTYHPPPNVNHYQPFGGGSPTPLPYTAPRFAASPLWDAFRERLRPNTNTYRGPMMGNRATRPPGSYERLRPPHLQRGGSRVGRAPATGSSSSILGEMW